MADSDHSCISPVDGSRLRRAADSRQRTQDVARRLRRAGAQLAQDDVEARCTHRQSGAAYCSQGGRRHARHERRDRARARLADGPAGPLWPASCAAFEERARYMIGIADESARAHRTRARRTGFTALHQARAARRRLRRRAVELSLSHRGQHDRAGADGRQRRDPEARSADAAGRRALRQGVRGRRPAEGLFQNLVLTHDQTAEIAARLGRVDHGATSPARSPAAAPSSGRRRHLHPLGLELGGKDPAYVRADADSTHAVENLVDGAFFNSGQCCCGIERIYVHEKRLRRASSRASSS